MNGKKLIKKIWIPVVSAFVIGVLGLSFFDPYVDANYEDYLTESENYLKKFTAEQQEYLIQISKKISSVNIDEKLISDLESEYVVQEQIKSKNKKYLWMETKKGEFVFGIPERAFNILNEGYKRYEDVIINDNHFRDRNDFLKNLIHQYDEINFSEWGDNQSTRRYSYHWRFYEETKQYDSPNTILQQAVFDNKNNVIGTLYLKVKDLENEEFYYSKWEFGNSTTYDSFLPLFGVFTIISSLFIWFLLPTWVYIDAQQRGVQNPLTWAILTLISLIFGLMIYLITRPATIKTLNCPHCDNELNGTRAFCPHCGYDLTSTFCQQCDYPIKPGWKFCPSCRTEIKSNYQTPTDKKESSQEDIEPENPS